MSSSSGPINRSAPGVRAPSQTTVRPPASGAVEIIQPSDYVDRRSEPRTNCDDRGALLFMSSNALVTCRILDQSPSGARVAFDKVDDIPAEIWLIDLDSHMVRRGASAWSTPTRMGLKFNFVQTLVPGQPRPARIPEDVFSAWLKLSGQTPPAPEAPDDDVLFLD